MKVRNKRKLRNGVDIPLLGLGVFQAADGEETIKAVRWAIESGYNHIDTARVYNNEKSVGQGIRDSAVPRHKIFITTKLWNDDMRAGRELEAMDDSLRDLGLDYVDLYLMHWPVEGYVESWRAMEKILASGKARAIGVSNFQQHHLTTLMAETTVVPAVNQCECHPFLSQTPLRKFCNKNGIAFVAWSPLGGKGAPVLDNQVIRAIAEKHGKSPAQVTLRWELQRGMITIPKSVHQERIIENRRVFDFELTPEDMLAIDGLNRDARIGPDPDNFDF